MDKDNVILIITCFIVMLVVSIGIKIFLDIWLAFILYGFGISVAILFLIVVKSVEWIYDKVTKSKEA